MTTTFRTLLLSLTVVLAWLLPVGLVFADTGPVELSLGVAAREKTSPALAEARAHFEEAARGSDDRSAADALYLLGDMDEAVLDFPAALHHYQASLARLPSSRYAPRAGRRAHELSTHSEGGFLPLVKLETIRRSAALANDPAVIDALAHDAESFPHGKVRVEARALAAEAYLGRLHRKDDAIGLLRLVALDPDAELLTARLAAGELVQGYVAKQDFASALAFAQASPNLLEPSTRKDIQRTMRRRPLRMAATADLAVLAAFALFALAGRERKRVVSSVREVAPMALIFAGLASGVGGYLASRYEQTSPYPFTAMLPAMFMVSVLARAWSAGGPSGSVARAFRGVVAFGGVFGAAFLLLDRMDPVYLAGFGL